MNAFHRSLAWIIITLLIGLFAFQVFRQEKEETEELIPHIFKEIQADVILKGIIYTRYSKDGSRFLLRAKDAFFFHTKNFIDFVQVDCILFPGKKNELQVKADRGDYLIDQERLALKGNVFLKIRQGQSLFTDILNFDGKKGLIWTDNSILMEGAGIRIQGTGFEYNLDSGKMNIKKQATTLESGSPALKH
jgi:LPS export ABC transporter protein LptC